MTGANTAATVAAMVADRFVFVSPATIAEQPVVALHLQPVPIKVFASTVTAELERHVSNFAAETIRRRGRRPSALVEPTWPEFPSRYQPGPGAQEGTPQGAALDLANYLNLLWTAWMQLEVIRFARPFLKPTGIAPRELPSQLTESGLLHPLPYI